MKIFWITFFSVDLRLWICLTNLGPFWKLPLHLAGSSWKLGWEKACGCGRGKERTQGSLGFIPAGLKRKKVSWVIFFPLAHLYLHLLACFLPLLGSLPGLSCWIWQELPKQDLEKEKMLATFFVYYKCAYYLIICPFHVSMSVLQAYLVYISYWPHFFLCFRAWTMDWKTRHRFLEWLHSIWLSS